MEILRPSKTRAQDTGESQECPKVDYSVSSVTDYSISSSEGWASASKDGSGVTVSVQNNTSPWVTTNPPVMEDRGAVITLVQAESGKRIDIGVHQSGKGYKEKYGLSGSPEYDREVSASDAYVDVTWHERKLWQADNDPSGPWNAFSGSAGQADTFKRTVSLSGMNSSSSSTRTVRFEFESARGVTVSGTVVQAKNRYTSAVTDFDEATCTLTPDKIFWGAKKLGTPPWIPFDPTEEDMYILENSSYAFPLELKFTPITTFIWEVYNSGYTMSAASATKETIQYKRPIDDFDDLEEEILAIQQGYLFADTVDESLREPERFIANGQYMDAYVYHSYQYYPRFITRDFRCSVIFKEVDDNGNIIDAKSTDGYFSVQVHHAVICDRDYSGNTRPSDLTFYQLDTSSVSSDTGGTTIDVDETKTLYWPNSGDTSFPHDWRRRYFYAYPTGEQVDMQKNATVFRGDVTTTADTTVANGYYRIEFTGAQGYSYSVSVTDSEGREITPESGKTMDADGSAVISDSMEWYPCQVVKETDGTTETISTEREVVFTITRNTTI